MDMDSIHSNEHSALEKLCANQLEIIFPPDIEKFHLRLGNNYDLKILVTLQFNLHKTDKDALVLCKDSFPPLTHEPKNSGDIDKAKFAVCERELRHDELPILKRDKTFNPNKLGNYAIFALLKIRNPVSMFNSSFIEFVSADRRVFFVRQYK